MKRIVKLVICLCIIVSMLMQLSFPCVASLTAFSIPYEKINNLQYEQKKSLYDLVETALVKKSYGLRTSCYSQSLDIELMDLSILQLEELQKYLSVNIVTVPYDIIDSLSPEDRSELIKLAATAIQRKRAGIYTSVYADSIDLDLMKLPLEELVEMKDVLSGILASPTHVAATPTPTAIPSPVSDNTTLANSTLDFAPILISNYFAWCSLFFVPDFDDTISTSGENEEGENTMNCDCISITYDNHTFDTKSVLFLYSYDKIIPIYQTNQDLRALSLFAAIELGKPDNFSFDDIKTAKREVMSILENLKSAMSTYKDKMGEVHFVPFFISKNGTYYVSSIDDGGILRHIIIVQ